MVDIPDTISTAAEATEALTGYVRWRGSLPRPGKPGDPAWELWNRGFGPPVLPLPNDQHVMARWLASRDSGPGPVVYAQRPGRAAESVPSKPLDAAKRGRFTVTAGHLLDTDPLVDIFRLVTQRGWVELLADRCAVLAEQARADSQDRHADRLAGEAAALGAFAAELDGALPGVAATWLAEWRQLAADHSPRPARPVRQPVRAAVLR